MFRHSVVRASRLQSILNGDNVSDGRNCIAVDGLCGVSLKEIQDGIFVQSSVSLKEKQDGVCETSNLALQ